MSMSIGCVGCGNMGGAILAGLAASSLDCTLYGHTRTAARMAPLEAAGVTRLDSARELAGDSEEFTKWLWRNRQVILACPAGPTRW